MVERVSGAGGGSKLPGDASRRAADLADAATGHLVGYDAAMLSQISQAALVLVRAAEEHGDPAVNPWFIGGGVLAFLLFLLLGLVWFGGGRDHS